MDVTFNEAVIDVPHSEESVTMRYTGASLTPERVLRCDWSVAQKLARQLVGKMSMAGEVVSWNLPHRFNHYYTDDLVTPPDLIPCVVSSVNIVGQARTSAASYDVPSDVGAGYDAAIAYDTAILQVNYESVPDTAEEMLVEETFEPTAEFITVSNRNLFWADGAKVKVDESPGLILKGMEWVYKIKRFPIIPPNILDYLGKTNSAIVHSFKFNKDFEIGTLLFTPPELVEFTDFTGQSLWEITYRFSVKFAPWNYFPRAGQTDFYPMYTAATGDTPYEPYGEIDFNDVLISTA